MRTVSTGTPFVVTRPSALVKKVGVWAKALVIFDNTTKHGVKANIMTYSAAISVCDKGRAWMEALALVERLAEERIEKNTLHLDQQQRVSQTWRPSSNSSARRLKGQLAGR